MAGLIVVGVNHHHAPVEVRERVAIDEARWRQFAPRSVPTVLLSTCNRVEVYAAYESRPGAVARRLERAFALATEMPWANLAPYATRERGHAALLHLVRVTAGLDSLIVGEDQIRGQVRDALRAANDTQELPSMLRGVFQRAAESARHVRGSTRLGKLPSIAVAAVHVARRALPDGLDGELAVVLGAGVMARAAAEALLSSGARVRVLNRTPEHALRMVGHLGPDVTVGGLDALPAALAEATLVLGATASRQPIVTVDMARAAAAARYGRPLLAIDIAVPRDIDAHAREVDGIRVLDLDDLERECPVDHATRDAEVARAEALAVEEANRLARWLRVRSASPAITELRMYAEGVRRRELERSSARLRDLTPEQVAAVDALTTGIVNKLLHGPTVALRSSPGDSRIRRALRPRHGRTA
jgi:glutamyl-tRNA reductase